MAYTRYSYAVARKNRKITISAVLIFMKFGTVMHLGPLGPSVKKFENLKIQDGGGCHVKQETPLLLGRPIVLHQSHNCATFGNWSGSRPGS